MVTTRTTFFKKFTKKFMPIIKFLNSIITPLANLNVDIAERFWVYFVGSFAEIQFYVKAIKEKK